MTVESSICDGAVVSLVLRDGRENCFFVCFFYQALMNKLLQFYTNVSRISRRRQYFLMYSENLV